MIESKNEASRNLEKALRWLIVLPSSEEIFGERLITTILKNPLHPSTFAYFLQDRALNIQAVHLLPEHLRYIESME